MSLIFLTRPDTAPGLRTVARGILVGQGVDIGRMVQLLRHLGAPRPETDEHMAWMGMATTQMPGMATDEQLEGLGGERRRCRPAVRGSDERPPPGGIHMAEFAAIEAGEAEVRDMAASLADSQAAEIAELQRS